MFRQHLDVFCPFLVIFNYLHLALQINSTDCICHACWELVQHELTGDQPLEEIQRQFGHRHVCVACGRSILRSDSRLLIQPGVTNDEQHIVDVISSWLQPDRQVCT